MSNIYHRIYRKLDTLGVIEQINTGSTSAKSQVKSSMDLTLDILETEKPGVIRISLSHYFEQNGDLCADPDMEIRVFIHRQMAEALTFQSAMPAIFQRVYPEPGRVNLALKNELNNFLDHWLGNCLQQQHTFKSNQLTRAQALSIIWKNRHPDYQSISDDGKKSILLLINNQTRLTPLSQLSDDAIRRLLPEGLILKD